MKVERTFRLVSVISPDSGEPHAALVLPQIERDGVVTEEWRFSERSTPDQLAALTEKIILYARDILEKNPPKRLILPISARAIVGDGNLSRIADAFHEIPEESRKRLIIEIHDFPKSLTLNAIENSTIPMLFFARGFIARMPAPLEDATVFANCNYIALSVDAADKTATADPIRNAWKAATPRRLKVFAWNVSAAEMPDAVRLDLFGVSTRR